MRDFLDSVWSGVGVLFALFVVAAVYVGVMLVAFAPFVIAAWLIQWVW